MVLYMSYSAVAADCAAARCGARSAEPMVCPGEGGTEELFSAEAVY
jgi:hypothetical protein